METGKTNCFALCQKTHTHTHPIQQPSKTLQAGILWFEVAAESRGPWRFLGVIVEPMFLFQRLHTRQEEKLQKMPENCRRGREDERIKCKKQEPK